MSTPFHLFEVFGVELEYMIVDRATLAVRPITDRLLQVAATLPGSRTESADGEWPNEVAMPGGVSWSNELTMHVVELKATEPAPSLAGVAATFHEHTRRIDALLAAEDARLLPTAMHPFMNPDTEMHVWPHGYSEVYSAFNRIFDCRGHGWANLQSAHLNLPFAGDEEFGRLHAAIRALLPIMPALSASSPFMDGRATGLADNRLEVYRNNSRRVPLMAGRVIPEPAYTRAEYESMIFEPLYAQLAPLDPEGVLRHEWANARGCIARFTRSAIEVRVLDLQERPAADLAILATISTVIRAMCEGRLGDLDAIKRLDIAPLHEVLLSVISGGGSAVVADSALLGALGLARTPLKASELWQGLLESARPGADFAEHRGALEVIFTHGCLANRIVQATGARPGHDRLVAVYRELADCLAADRAFIPG